MPRKSRKATPETMPVIVQENRIVVDHPRENEVVRGFHYAVRISASECERVELSLDDKSWMPCRSAAGHWWYDLRSVSAGKHKLEIRMHNAGTVAGARRIFEVL